MLILDRYLRAEVLRALGAVTAILLLTTVGLFLGDTLADVARGRVPPQLLLTQLGLRSLEALTILVPLSFFLATMMTFGRLYRDSEMVVLSACGVSRFALLRPVLRLGTPLFLILLVLGVWVAPWAQRTSKNEIAAVTSNLSIAGLQAGRFQTIAAHDSVVYVEDLTEDGLGFGKTFIHLERDGRKDIITAESGFQYVDPASGAKYLALLNGRRVEGVPGAADFRIMTFARNDVRVPEREADQPGLKRGALTLSELRAGSTPEDYAEIHWRIAPALALIAFALLAVPLSYSRPRQGYYGNLVIGILVYVVYANLLALGRSWLEREELPIIFGLWWLPIAAGVASWMLLRRERRRRFKAVAQA